MHHNWKRLVIGSLCLATLLLASGPPLKSHAAARTLLQPGDYFCTPTDPVNTGVSYDATYYDLDDNANETAGVRDFSFAAPGSALDISAWACNGNLVAIGIEATCCDFGFDYINVETTVNGVTTVTAPTFNLVGAASDDLESFTTLLEAPHQLYTFRVQHCFFGYGCQDWSPHLQVLLAANPFCQNGYVWRQADFYGDDHVCVPPWERDQAAYDNSQRAARWVDPLHSDVCIPGYVWREAWGGDDTCVDPPQRDQVLYDNSQALNRIVAL